jgi:hypothetical protein
MTLAPIEYMHEGERRAVALVRPLDRMLVLADVNSAGSVSQLHDMPGAVPGDLPIAAPCKIGADEVARLGPFGRATRHLIECTRGFLTTIFIPQAST